MKIGLVQMNSKDDKIHNMSVAERFVKQLADQGAEFILLPEHTDFIGPDRFKRDNAEPLNNSSYIEKMRSLADSLDIHLHIGSYLEQDGANVYNTGVVFDPDGKIVATYRKLHLFDVEIPGGRTYLESATITGGSDIVTFSIGKFTFGMTTCYDLRFPELYRRLVQQGANVLLVPAAFTMETGRDHWELLLKARAVENLSWVIGINQWGTSPPNHNSYGRSMVISPWGLVVAQVTDGAGTLVADIDIDSLEETRTRFPALNHIRDDLFSI